MKNLIILSILILGGCKMNVNEMVAAYEIQLKDFYVTVFNQFHISFLPFYLEQVKLKTNKVKEKSCCIIV